MPYEVAVGNVDADSQPAVPDSALTDSRPDAQPDGHRDGQPDSQPDGPFDNPPDSGTAADAAIELSPTLSHIGRYALKGRLGQGGLGQDNRRELKKYRGQWIAYTNQGVISCDRDYRKMKDGIPADTPDRKSTRLNSSHSTLSRMPSSA